MTGKKALASKKAPPASRYNRLKEFNGRRYTGMTVGRTHHWRYDESDWKEKKVTPEKWEFAYGPTKRRAGRAPEGSGAPVGTAYHWFILAHQFVQKLNANEYATQMAGLKFKLAHKRASNTKWSASNEQRRKHLIAILKELIANLEREPEQLEPIAIDVQHGGKTYRGLGIPILTSCDKGICRHFDIMLNDKHVGMLRDTGEKWALSEIKSQSLIDAIGRQIEERYRRAA